MKLNPAFVMKTKRRSLEIQEMDKTPLKPTGMVGDLAKMWESACPTMFRLLTEAGILLEYANVLVESVVRQVMQQNTEAGETLQRLQRETYPSSSEMEQEWINLHTSQAAPTTT